MMFKPMLSATAAVALLASVASAQTVGVPTPGVSLVIRDGLVTLKAEQASLRQILAEWERLGQVRFVGADKLTGGPVTLSLTDIPEKQALEIVMRGVPGYMAIDRSQTATPSMAASTSRFDRVVVMARAATPVPAASMAGGRMPSPAQPVMPTPEGFLQPMAPDDDTAPAQPERNDVEQFSNATEPPMPQAPVASPYPNAYPGSPYAGANGANQQIGPYGGNATAAAAAAGTAAAPETQFDYANPQKYFEQRRLQQEAAAAQPTAFPTSGTGGATPGRTAQPTGVPTAPGTLARPGIAPTPQATPQPQGEFFNPYNLPADWVPPPPVTTDTSTPIEPDRAKYTNPYEQPKPPEE
jgi:hypothetical protein